MLLKHTLLATHEMPDFDYHVWFRNQLMDQDEEDHEWVACFRVCADDASSAKQWGDLLARDYSLRTTNCEFLRSGIEAASEQSLPLVVFGQHVSDAYIGW